MPSLHRIPDALPSEHEIRSVRTFPVTRRVLFSTFTNPAVLASWWGPEGSVNVFHTFELQPGGFWRFAMHTADGSEYEMVNEFLEVTAPERIVLWHPQPGHEFELQMHYAATGPTETQLSWCMRFVDAAEASRVRTFVVEANEQNFDRLEAVLGLPSARRWRGVPPAV